MDLGKFSRNGTWLFADKIEQPVLLEFVRAAEHIDKNGKAFPVLECLGKANGWIGDVFISVYRLQLDPKLVEVLGSDTDEWGTPLLYAAKGKDNKILVSLATDIKPLAEV